MKEGFDLAQVVLHRLGKEATRCGTTISSLVDMGLRHVLAELPSSRSELKTTRQLPTWDSGEFRAMLPTVMISTGYWANRSRTTRRRNE